MAAEVLNGSVEVGDTIAYAVHGGSSLDMRIGQVTEVEPYPWEQWDYEARGYVTVTKYRLRVEVELTNGMMPKRSVFLTELDRVAKLS